MSPISKLALPVLAAASAVYAQSSCSNTATSTIQNSGDATALAGCKTYSGDVAIATGTTDDISFDGQLTKIDGNLFVESNSKIQRLGGSSLTTVTKELRLNDVSQLASLTFPALNSVDTLTLTGLANLRATGFSNLTTCNNLHIENTQLQDMAGINLMSAKTINIANNGGITNVSMPLTTIDSNFTVSQNSADAQVSFPSLYQAHNMVFRGVASISIPSLGQIKKGDFYVLNSKLDTVAAPNLTTIEGALVLAQNNNLNNVSFPQLQTVQANLQIANNSNLHDLSGFPALKEVDAAFDMSGNITKVSTPNLDLVKGVFNLQSTGDFGDACTAYNSLRDKGKISKGSYVCQGNLQKAGTAGTKPSATGSSKPSGAASPLNVQNTYLGLAGLAAVMLW